jgi:hypothetical protein
VEPNPSTFSPKTRKEISKLSHKNLNFLSGLDCLSLNILQENDSLIFDASEKLVKKRQLTLEKQNK